MHISQKILLGGSLCSLMACSPSDPLRTAKNPDPNHTHADFAVFANGAAIDFSSEKYMSGESEEDDDHDHVHRHEYMHLHDGIGTVIHRHKPGLSIGELFNSLDFRFTERCLTTDAGQQFCSNDQSSWRMVVNGQEVSFDSSYVFEDVDQILLSYGADDSALAAQWEQMTDDACLYSRTCPQRGNPPAENCIADPAVPCVAPPE
jgi:hypothetical protein